MRKTLAALGLLSVLLVSCGGATSKSEPPSSNQAKASDPTTTSITPTTVAPTTTAAASVNRDIQGTIDLVLDQGKSTCGDDSPDQVTILDGVTGKTISSATFYVVPGTHNCEAKGTWKNVPPATMYKFYAPSQHVDLGQINPITIHNNSVTISIDPLVGIPFVV